MKTIINKKVILFFFTCIIISSCKCKEKKITFNAGNYSHQIDFSNIKKSYSKARCNPETPVTVVISGNLSSTTLKEMENFLEFLNSRKFRLDLTNLTSEYYALNIKKLDNLVSIITPKEPNSINIISCYNLTEVTIPEDTEYTSYFITDCPGIKTLNLPKTLYTLKIDFSQCPNVREINIPEERFLIINDGFFMDYTKTELFFVLPESQKTQELVLPDSLKHIYTGAFAAENNLKAIKNIPIVYRYYNSAFPTPDNRKVFRNISTLETIEFKESGGRIPGETFALCPNLKNIVLPKNITSIGDSAFYGCTSLESLEIVYDEYFEYLGKEAFYGCSSLKQIILPQNLEIIYSMTFSKTGISSIELPSNLTSIEHGAFSNTPLKSITIPSKVTQINSKVFEGCSELKEITLPSGLESIKEMAFKDCTSLEHIDLPQGLKEIRDNCFENCTSLNELVFPDSITYIGSNIIAGCNNIKEITIPYKRNLWIRNDCFAGCSSLEKIYFTGTKEDYYHFFDRTTIYEPAVSIFCTDGELTLEDRLKIIEEQTNRFWENYD